MAVGLANAGASPVQAMNKKKDSWQTDLVGPYIGLQTEA